MKHLNKQLGGFVALNTGQIFNCYSRVRLRHTSRAPSAGFCGENRGSLDCCAAQGIVAGRGKKHGFCGPQKGRCSRSFWLRGRDEQESDWTDWDRSLSAGELTGDDLKGWDLDQVWHLHDAGAPVRLSLYDRAPETGEYERVVEIHDRRGLLDFAREVNDGGGDGTLYRLTADISLGGRRWTPVGLDPNTPFRGCFDGGGHQIHDFVLQAGKFPFAGFFGCIGKDGAVRNLRVDCVLLGKGTAAAPLCAVNDGEIVNCTAVFHGQPSRYTGGLTAQNGGTIHHSAALGRVGRNLIPWWLAAVLLLALCIPLPLYFSLTALAAPGQEVFAPVIQDPNAVPVDPREEIQPEPDEVTDTSASFIMNAEMAVGTGNYAGAIGLRCPTWSSRGFVATVRVAGEDLDRLGLSGSELPVLYQSGLIAPGYGVDVITLGSLPDGRKLPAGEYELSVLLEFYDMETYEKSAVNTVVPLEVTVQ